MLTTTKLGGRSPTASDSTRLPRAGSWLRRSAGWAALAFLVAACAPPGVQAIRRGQTLLRGGEPAAALKPLQKALALFATNAPVAALVWNEVGLAYRDLHRPNLAVEAYNNALRLDRNLIAAHYNRGCLYLENNYLQPAIDDFRTYLSFRANNGQAWLALGTAFLHARQSANAETCFRRALRLPMLPAQQAEAWNNLGVLRARQRHPHQAWAYLQSALKAQTNYPPTLLNLGIVAQAQLREPALALAQYRSYVAVAPQAANAPQVKVLIAALDRQLHPPPPPQPVVTHTNPPPATNALLATSPVPRPTPHRAAPTNAVTSPPRPATSPSPPAKTATTPQPKTTSPPPETRVARNPAPVAETNAPVTPEVATNATAMLVPVKTNHVTEPPLETVHISGETQFQSAQAVSLPPPAPGTTSTNESASLTNALTQTHPRLLRVLPVPQEKRSFWQRMNPMNLFRSKARAKGGRTAEPKVVPLAHKPSPTPAPTEEVATNEAALALTPMPVAPAPPPPPPTYPRYNYLSPKLPPAGNFARARPLFLSGVRAQEFGQDAQAATDYRHALEADPRLFEAYFNLGVLAQRQGDLNGALAQYERALAVRPDDTRARYNFALALNAAGYPLDSVDELQKLAAKDPSFADAHVLLGQVYAEKLQDTAKARTQYRKALELEPNLPSANQIRLWLRAHPPQP